MRAHKFCITCDLELNLGHFESYIAAYEKTEAPMMVAIVALTATAKEFSFDI